MSRYESSRFIKNPDIMNIDVLKLACRKLGWKYYVSGDTLTVTSLGDGQKLYGEYALKVTGNKVTYNSYYLDNGVQAVEKLKKEFYRLNVEYARDSVIEAFTAKGFSYKKDYSFVPNEEVADHFSMVGFTELKGEKEKRYEIAFSILTDGTVITDSNYLPDDVNENAHAGMDELQKFFGNARIMTKKPEYDAFIRKHNAAKTSINDKYITH